MPTLPPPYPEGDDRLELAALVASVDAIDDVDRRLGQFSAELDELAEVVEGLKGLVLTLDDVRNGRAPVAALNVRISALSGRS